MKRSIAVLLLMASASASQIANENIEQKAYVSRNFAEGKNLKLNEDRKKHGDGEMLMELRHTPDTHVVELLHFSEYIEEGTEGTGMVMRKLKRGGGKTRSIDRNEGNSATKPSLINGHDKKRNNGGRNKGKNDNKRKDTNKHKNNKVNTKKPGNRPKRGQKKPNRPNRGENATSRPNKPDRGNRRSNKPDNKPDHNDRKPNRNNGKADKNMQTRHDPLHDYEAMKQLYNAEKAGKARKLREANVQQS